MPTPYSPAAGKVNPRFAGDQLEELVRRLDENARAVAGIGLATARATVIQVQQDLQRLLNDGMGLPPLDVHHEADAAGLVLELRIVKPLFARGGPARANRDLLFVSALFVMFRRFKSPG